MRVSREKLDPSIAAVAARLADEYAGVPLIVLGQTVFWDEPVKDALFAVLDTLHPGQHRLRLGINDHDYFSKTAAPLPTDEPFAIREHNDGTTRDLWVATGELSMLFGSETILSREILRDYGVELEKVARDAPEGHNAFIDRVTTAWGWRGIVQTGDRRQIAHEIRLSEVLPHLLDLLRWGFCESAALLHGQQAVDAAARFTDGVTEWLRRFDREHADALLSDAYRAMHLRCFRHLTGREPEHVETFTSTDAFRFSRETAGLRRFALLDIFLKPETRDIARDAYNRALEGAQTYTLDRFGEGAIPFDLIVPGNGRGTVRILADGIAVATPEPIWLATPGRVESAQALAEVTEQHLGAGVALVGKGLVFVCMVTADGILVFHEGGSAYVHRTERMLRQMADAGIHVPLYPILRVRHHTWDALAGTDLCFHLPEYLSETFGTPFLCGAEMARRWREVMAEQEGLLAQIGRLGGTQELVECLARLQDGHWTRRLDEYRQAYDVVLRTRDRSQEFEARSQHLYEEIQRRKQETQELESAKGASYRETIKPLRERLWELSQQGVTAGPEVETLQRRIAEQDAPRAELDRTIREQRQHIGALEQEAKAVRKARVENEKGQEAARARRTMAAIEREAEQARLELVRRALLVTRGLPQSNLRPSAWWFPLVDPSGRWFENLAHNMELYFEPLCP